MSPSLVQSQQGSIASGSSLTITLGSPTTSGHCLVVCVGTGSTSTFNSISTVELGGVADNFAKAIATPSTGAFYLDNESWVDLDCAGGQTSVTVTFTGSTTALVEVMEWSGVATVSAVDKTHGNLGASAFSSGATGTLSQASEVVIGSVLGADPAGPSITGPGAPWTNFAEIDAGSYYDYMAGYQVVNSTSSQTYSGTVSGLSGNYSVTNILSLKAATATPVTVNLTTAQLNVTAYPLSIPATLSLSKGAVNISALPVTPSYGPPLPPAQVSSISAYPLSVGPTTVQLTTANVNSIDAYPVVVSTGQNVLQSVFRNLTLARPVVFPLDDAPSPVSNILVAQWNTITRSPSQKTFYWNITAQGIYSQKSFQFNTFNRIHVTGWLESSSLVRPVVYPLDSRTFTPSITFNVYRRSVNSSLKSLFRVSSRISSYSAYKFEIRETFYKQEVFEFNVRGLVHKPGVTSGTWINQVSEITTHPLSSPNFTVSPYFEWDSEKRLSKIQGIRFNDLVSRISRLSFAFNDNTLTVTKQQAIDWNLNKQLSSDESFKFNTIQRLTYSKRSFTWQLKEALVSRHSIQWDAANFVNKTEAFSWSIDHRLEPKLEIRFRTLTNTSNWLGVRFHDYIEVKSIKQQLQSSSSGNVDTPVFHPITFRMPAATQLANKGLGEPVVQPVDVSNNIGYGLNGSPGFTFNVGINPSGRVTAQVSIEFNDLKAVVSDKAVSWVTTGRFQLARILEFNIYSSATSSIIMEWNIGSWTKSHIRQTAQVRTDFSY